MSLIFSKLWWEEIPEIKNEQLLFDRLIELYNKPMVPANFQFCKQKAPPLTRQGFFLVAEGGLFALLMILLEGA